MLGRGMRRICLFGLFLFRVLGMGLANHLLSRANCFLIVFLVLVGSSFLVRILLVFLLFARFVLL